MVDGASNDPTLSTLKPNRVDRDADSTSRRWTTHTSSSLDSAPPQPSTTSQHPSIHSLHASPRRGRLPLAEARLGLDSGVAEAGVEEGAQTEELDRVCTTCQMAVASCPMGCGSFGSTDRRMPPTG